MPLAQIEATEAREQVAPCARAPSERRFVLRDEPRGELGEARRDGCAAALGEEQERAAKHHRARGLEDHVGVRRERQGPGWGRSPIVSRARVVSRLAERLAVPAEELAQRGDRLIPERARVVVHGAASRDGACSTYITARRFGSNPSSTQPPLGTRSAPAKRSPPASNA